MNRLIEDQIEALLDGWSDLNDDDFVEACKEALDRIQTAHDAKVEELGGADPSPLETDEEA